MIQHLQPIFVHLMQTADQWQTCTFQLRQLLFLCVIVRGDRLNNPNAATLAAIYSSSRLRSQDPTVPKTVVFVASMPQNRFDAFNGQREAEALYN